MVVDGCIHVYTQRLIRSRVDVATVRKLDLSEEMVMTVARRAGDPAASTIARPVWASEFAVAAAAGGVRAVWITLKPPPMPPFIEAHPLPVVTPLLARNPQRL